MGLSSSTQKQTVTNAPSQQSIQAGNTLNSTFAQQLPKIQGYADQIGGLIPQMMARFQQGNPALNAANDYVVQTLSREGGNPFLQQMIDQSGGDMANAINASVGTRGITGGSVQQRILANELSKNAMNLRYQDFNTDQQRRMQAAGMAPQLAAGDAIGIAPLLSVAQYAGGAPLDATSQYAAGMGSLFGNTGSQTTTTKQSGGLLGGLLGAALGGWATGGFKRI